MMAKYDSVNPQALQAAGRAAARKLRPFSQAIMEACFKAAQGGLCRDLGQSNADFKKVYDIA